MIVNRIQRPDTELLLPRHRAGAREATMNEHDDENGTETDDAAEDFSDDLEVQIYEAILAREKTGDSFPDRSAVEAMEEPLHRLTGAAVLFRDITMESSAGPELRMRGLSFRACAGLDPLLKRGPDR
jgi:hypothetical protein